VSTVVWLVGFGLMMFSFTFLFGKSDQHAHQPRISVEPWWPAREHDRR